jgi:RNA polymerase sigma factor (sigma-70 family)
MEWGSARSALRQIRTLYSLGTLGDLPDAQLLEVFLARTGDDVEAAFEALMHRHGPMVMGVCRRMLRGSHDWEDAFQATFLVLARRAASIGRREQLANWLYGVAVRTAKVARRRAARDRMMERRMMDVPRVESEPTADDRDELLAELDEELNRLPRRYRAALMACELDGKSRREAAQQLGIPEGTLSTHLARGRKLLRERLQRRGVRLGVGQFAGLTTRPITEAAVPDRLIGVTVRAAMSKAAGCATAGTVSKAVSSLAERVLKMMFLTRLTLVIAALMTAAGAAGVVALGLTAQTGKSADPDPPKPGPDDLSGRVVDKAGAGAAGVQVWLMGGRRGETETLATVTTDGQGRFLLPRPPNRDNSPGFQTFGLLGRARDGQVGWLWLGTDWPNGADGKSVEVELGPVGDVRGRLTDQNARPIAGVEVKPVLLTPSANASPTDYIRLSPEVGAVFRTTTASDGSFVLPGIPRGAGIFAAIAAPAFGSPAVSWDTTQTVSIVLDSRLGRIQGRLRPPDARGLPRELSLGLHLAPRPAGSARRPFELVYIFKSALVDQDGAFQFGGLPPGRYVVNAYFNRDGIIATKPENEVEVGPGAVAQLEIPIQRLPRVTGRVVDARTGKGIAGIGLRSLSREAGRNLFVAEATTDAEGRYTIAARPGKTAIELAGVPKSYAGLDFGQHHVSVVKADLSWPDLKLAPATDLDGIVVDASGQPITGAEIFTLRHDRRDEPVRTGPGGTFHFEQLDPDDTIPLWARAGDATTNGTVVVRPKDIKDKVTLTVDPNYTVRIRGLVTDASSKRVAGAKATLRWNRPMSSEKPQWRLMSSTSILESSTTGEDGWFVFRDLWPGLTYSIVIEARGHNKAEAPQLTGKAGETHDVGKMVLINTSGHLAGRVIGSDGRPIPGAAVFNRGDGPEPVATSTDPQGRFRLEGLFPGTKYALVRKEGFRFTGYKAVEDADDLTITLLKTTEPPPAWTPGRSATYDEQRAFAKKVLIRIWEKHGANAQNNGAFSCIMEMARIDLELALDWSARLGHRYDDWARQAAAEELADTDAPGALELLNQKLEWGNQRVLQTLADRFAESDPKKAMLFANEAGVRSRGLNQPDRTLAMAWAGAVLVRLGRADVGRKLIDEAAHGAAQLGTENRAGYYRGLVAQVLAPFDLKRALALIEPIKDENKGKDRYRAMIAVAIATTDTNQAVALVEKVGGNAFYHELARTEIAYKIGADHPDAAIQIIEGMKREPRWDPRWQAEAFGWLAVALAPRDRARAFGLIDRALAMMIDHRDWAGSDREMAAAARIALCARRIGYPDMESAIVRVLAAQPGDERNALSNRGRMIQSITEATVLLALIDPDAARTVLEQIEARGGLDPITLWNTREPWLTAWALVDLKKAEALFEAGLAAIEGENEIRVRNAGSFSMTELLATPPHRREEALGKRSFGGFWWPGRPL